MTTVPTITELREESSPWTLAAWGDYSARQRFPYHRGTHSTVTERKHQNGLKTVDRIVSNPSEPQTAGQRFHRDSDPSPKPMTGQLLAAHCHSLHQNSIDNGHDNCVVPKMNIVSQKPQRIQCDSCAGTPKAIVV
jgi:hypothetical protein